MTRETARKIRQIVLEQSRRANVGHIGSALSVADILAVLYSDILRIKGPGDPERDRFILSKGHAALALYAALHLKGWLPAGEINSFCAEGTRLGVHPETSLPGVDFATGSLGHGLSIGAGSALAARLQGSGRKVFVLLSDAECNEGSVWEAAMFAAHHRLRGLTAIIDRNGQQALGRTENILSLEPLTDRWQSFGWNVSEVDGHDHVSLKAALDTPGTGDGPPHLVVAQTTFGRGVSYMENQLKWHYWPMSETEFQQALREIGAGP